jgi:hypothetical protein
MIKPRNSKAAALLALSGLGIFLGGCLGAAPGNSPTGETKEQKIKMLDSVPLSPSQKAAAVKQIQQADHKAP